MELHGLNNVKLNDYKTHTYGVKPTQTKTISMVYSIPILKSMRRFLVLPAGVLLSAIGFVSPK
jgi:hypothetical protein